MAAFFAEGNGERLDDVSAFLAAHDISGELNAVLRRMKLNRFDLADVLTAYLIISWEIVNDRDASTQTTGVQKLRQQLRAALLKGSEVRNASEENRQRTAETLGYLAVLGAASQNEFGRRRDTAALANLHASVSATALHLTGLDLRHLMLSANGFVFLHEPISRR